MTAQRKKWLMAFVSIVVLVAIITWAGCKKQPSEQADTENTHSEALQPEPGIESTDDTPEQEAKIPDETKTSLFNIISAARTWRPAFEIWFGKEAPDFTLTDITGKQHKLSDYQGRNVMITFWSTLYGPCRMEIPDLIELRRKFGEDKLAMLAISNESLPALTKAVTQYKINYTVFSNQETLPEPYSLVNFIPCSFFINPKGNIKLATEGLLPLNDIIAIIQSQ